LDLPPFGGRKTINTCAGGAEPEEIIRGTEGRYDISGGWLYQELI
jgi:hypothetical protein